MIRFVRTNFPTVSQYITIQEILFSNYILKLTFEGIATFQISLDMKVESRILFSLKFVVVVGFFVFICIFATTAMTSDRFLDNGDGTVTDAKTGLMWAAKDNGIPINWPDALSYCRNFRGGGHTDWRMPTLAELAGLYDPEHINRRGQRVNKLIQISAQTCWASENRGFEAARFNFVYGQVYWLRQSYSGPTRVLPVRSGN